MDLLQEAREEIDLIDKEMAQLFHRRMTAVRKVVTHKIQHNLPILDQGREAQVVEKNLALFPEDELKSYYKDFVVHTMGIAKALQSKIMATDLVGYQGVAGAFSHIAMKALFPHSREASFETWKEVVLGVEEGRLHYAVLPFENSHAGDVSEVLDLCFTHGKIHVCAMYDLAIQQNLLGVKGSTLEDIKTVVSHPQALMQSAGFLEQHKLQKQEYANTAAAAEHVAKLEDKTVGAIASTLTAELYDLDILAYHINESADNTTRFLVITKETPTVGNRFSVLFTVNHRSGSLAQVLSLVASEGINMESIKSRPMPQVSWEYYFYMELVGNGEQAHDLGEKLLNVCQSVRILGIYNREDGQ